MLPSMRRTVRLAMLVLLGCAAATAASAQQAPDTSFDVRVAHPAFATRHPRVAIDEAHHNFHTMEGRYEPFAALIRNDGCDVVPGREAFTARTLSGLDILVIANALGAEEMDDTAAAHPAFTADECRAVRTWVERGGALLLIADHSPMGAAAKALGAELGVDMACSYAADPVQGRKGSESIVAYTTAQGLAPDHPIIRGRDSTETLHRVVAFTGQSLAGPPGSTQLLRFSDRAVDLVVGYGRMREAGSDQKVSAKGRAQGLAFTLGKGRVVVLGEAAMMTAQVAAGRFKMGMNEPGNDDRQFVLNVVRWLGGAL